MQNLLPSYLLKKLSVFAECFAIEAECFAKHSVNDSLNLYKDFDDAFADAFLDVAHERSRIEVADNDVVKNSHQSERKERNVQSTM